MRVDDSFSCDDFSDSDFVLLILGGASEVLRGAARDVEHFLAALLRIVRGQRGVFHIPGDSVGEKFSGG